VSTQAALLSAPQHAEGHRRRAAELLDHAEQRAGSTIVRAQIDSVRRELIGGAQEQNGPGKG